MRGEAGDEFIVLAIKRAIKKLNPIYANLEDVEDLSKSVKVQINHKLGIKQVVYEIEPSLKKITIEAIKNTVSKEAEKHDIIICTTFF